VDEIARRLPRWRTRTTKEEESMSWHSRIAVIFAIVASSVLLVSQTALASLIYVTIPVPGTPCDFVIEGDVDTRLVPPAWAHAGFICTG
jgi:hypothetical protein